MDESQKEFLKNMIEDIEEKVNANSKVGQKVDKRELVDRVIAYNSKGEIIEVIDDIENIIYFAETSNVNVHTRVQLVDGPSLLIYAHENIKEQIEMVIKKVGGREEFLGILLNEMKGDLDNA